MTFYDFLICHFKKRKKSCFLKSEKNEKYVFSNIGQQYQGQSTTVQPKVWIKCNQTKYFLTAQFIVKRRVALPENQ